MGSRVVPSGVGSLDNSLSHPITLRAPPPLPSPNLPATTTTVSPCSVGSHHESHYNDTITGSYWVNGARDRENERERGWWGALHMEGFAITVHILWVHSVIEADVCGCLSLMGSCFNFTKNLTDIKHVYWMLRGNSCIASAFLLPEDNWPTDRQGNIMLQQSGICSRNIFSSLKIMRKR